MVKMKSEYRTKRKIEEELGVEWLGKKSNEKSSEEPWKDGVGKVEVVVVIEKKGVGIGEIPCP